jgi:hypothetical protein
MGFDPTIPVFERTTTFRALYLAGIAIGTFQHGFHLKTGYHFQALQVKLRAV